MARRSQSNEMWLCLKTTGCGPIFFLGASDHRDPPTPRPFCPSASWHRSLCLKQELYSQPCAAAQPSLAPAPLWLCVLTDCRAWVSELMVPVCVLTRPCAPTCPGHSPASLL